MSVHDAPLRVFTMSDMRSSASYATRIEGREAAGAAVPGLCPRPRTRELRSLTGYARFTLCPLGAGRRLARPRLGAILARTGLGRQT
ncbi:MAG TPA: hypothetical protein VEV86_13105, partial [Vicinamibacterales bacterium]|nr:hypothetical protein [Vicinamibacterales bacterium]